MSYRDKIQLIRSKEREYLTAACDLYDREARENEWIALLQFRELLGLDGPIEDQVIGELAEILTWECPESAFLPCIATLRRSTYGGN